MQVTIKTTNFIATPEISSYLNNKLESVRKLIDSKDTTALCEVELERTTTHHQGGRVYRAEFNIRTAAAGLIRVESTEEGMEAAIDVAKDEAIKRLRRKKGKYMAALRRGGGKVKEWLRGWRGR
jgi:ribosomal subunit interface protein